MFKRKFLIEVDFTEEELQNAAEAFGVSIQELTEEKLAESLENALGGEFEGIKVQAIA